MEVRDRSAQAHAGGQSRVYSPTHGSSAYAYAPAAPKQQPVPRPEQRPEPRRQPRPEPKPRLAAGTRLALLLSVMMLSAVLLMVVLRYNNIAAQYAMVNVLQETITETEQEIRTLNVMLESAVSIQEVQEEAQRWGMSYPEADQYVRTGDALPVSRTQADPEPPPGDTEPAHMDDPEPTEPTEPLE